ncbi:MAG: NCS2 family permease [Deltaproteobacteria bacterium]|nr:NCS2 family permease [Deltaproteobacteria bacterium]
MTQNKPISIRTEFIAGVTTFFTMAYIVVVNPSILASPGTGMSFSGVLTATVLLCLVMTLFMGLYAKLPFAVAPGMGINAFFTYTVIIGKNVPWPTALGTVFWAGVLFVLISVTPARVAIANAIPRGLRCAAAAGIGIFLTFIGLKNVGFVAADPVTLVKLGTIDAKTLLSFAGFGLIIFLMHKKSPLAFLIGIFMVTALALSAGFINAPARFLSWPDFGSVFFKLDIWGSLKLAVLPVIVSIMLTDLFDSISTFVGVSHATKLFDANGQPKNLKEGLIVDAFATMGAGLFGTSSGTAYIESVAGIEMGGRTGLTSVFTALCFIPCFFIAPLAGMVPAFATAPVLVIVGGLMFKSVRDIPLDHIEDILPAFLTIILIPLTFSITQGILWGMIAHVVMYLMTGRRKEIKPMLYVIAVVAVALLAIEQGF